MVANICPEGWGSFTPICPGGWGSKKEFCPGGGGVQKNLPPTPPPDIFWNSPKQILLILFLIVHLGESHPMSSYKFLW